MSSLATNTRGALRLLWASPPPLMASECPLPTRLDAVSDQRRGSDALGDQLLVARARSNMRSISSEIRAGANPVQLEAASPHTDIASAGEYACSP
jgi:hypothetical protein